MASTHRPLVSTVCTCVLHPFDSSVFALSVSTLLACFFVFHAFSAKPHDVLAVALRKTSRKTLACNHSIADTTRVACRRQHFGLARCFGCRFKHGLFLCMIDNTLYLRVSLIMLFADNEVWLTQVKTSQRLCK